LAHAYALIHQCLCHLAIGASVFFPPTPLLGPVLCRTLEEQAISTLTLVPTVLGLLTDGLERTGRTCPNLRLITVGAAQADPAALARLKALLPHTTLALTYGLTEAGPRVATRFLDGELGDPAAFELEVFRQLPEAGVAGKLGGSGGEGNGN
jgi:acyl-CoA synthetase (AMP-forming)/AMP-acid ligase II